MIKTPEETARAVSTYRHIRDNPTEHDQGVFYRPSGCGTKACFAGHAILRTPGWRVSMRGPFGMALPVHALVRVTDWWVAGRIVLGLTVPEGDRLFDAGNTLEDLRHIIGDVYGVDPETGAYYSIPIMDADGPLRRELIDA